MAPACITQTQTRASTIAALCSDNDLKWYKDRDAEDFEA